MTKTFISRLDQSFDLDRITQVVHYILRGTGSNQRAHHYQNIHGNFQCDLPLNDNQGDSNIHTVLTPVCSHCTISGAGNVF